MNPIYLFTTPLLLVACASLFAWMTSGQRLRTLCPSAGDLLMLPFVGLYLLMLLAGGWVCCGVEFLAPRSEAESGEQPSRPQPSRHPHHAAT